VSGAASGADDRRFMALALGLAARGLGNVWPNPAVGCVIVRDGRIVGRGWTQPGGRPHAESVALAQAGAHARGATAYVTLEPCAHHGKTPPCTDALIAAGVARVVTALTDPDPRVAGGGHDRLRAAGIALTEGIMAAEAGQVNAGFLSRVTRGRPYLTLKLATTLDGRIATVTGESRWITGPEARRHVHALRMQSDAVMIGAGTARADDPELTARDMGARHQPLRVVLDSRLSLDPGNRLGRTAGEVPVWLCHGPDAPACRRTAWQASGARLIPVPMGDLGLDIHAVLAALAEAGLTRVMCEGGARLAAALVNAELVDEIWIYSAGRILGGDALAAIGPLGIRRMPQGRPAFRMIAQDWLGDDLFSRWLRR
jgi:diaminohydroxyphosphoribosylaminopyrimidine deaminase/5-amino-6-(5-phosphoribosylamino)uracil reductase